MGDAFCSRPVPRLRRSVVLRLRTEVECSASRLSLRSTLHEHLLIAAIASVSRHLPPLAFIAHRPHRSLRGLRIPSLLAVDGNAVLQIRLSRIVALEMDLIEGMVSVFDDLEVGELIGSLRLSFGRLASCRIQASSDTAKGHGSKVVQAVTRGCGALGGSRLLLRDRRSLCGGIPGLRVGPTGPSD